MKLSNGARIYINVKRRIVKKKTSVELKHFNKEDINNEPEN
jgi:hypothetical protein